MGTVLIVDDNSLFRRFLEINLPRLLPHFEFVFAGSADSLRNKIEALPALHCLVIDYDLGPGQPNGIKLSEEIRHKFPNIKIILLSSHVSDFLKADASRHRIHYCVSKFDDLYEWVKLIGL
jgi:DNA-binding NarL/FixJ family response regulator